MKNKAFVLKLRQQLLKRRDALVQALRGQVNVLHSREIGVGDQLDDSFLDEAQGLHSQLAEAESREFAQIERALQRMRSGKFGQCDRCKKAIGLPRLQAIPHATECITCAREAERRRELGIFDDERENADEELEIG
jgi:DnaK suppressor protein